MPPKKTESGAPKKSSTTAGHHSYQDMIKDAIINLKDRKGSSRVALKKYVKANNNISATDKMFDSLFNKALKSGVEKGEFSQPKGSSGGTKLARKEPKPAAKPTPNTAAAKPAATKPKAAATKKAAITKKVVASKKATTASSKKAPAPKKAAASKAKKPAAKKAGPAVVEKAPVLGKTKSGRVTKTTAKTPAAKKAAPKKPAAKKAAPAKKAAA